MGLLITGTDTGAGKTVLTTALMAYWRKYKPHQRLAILKLVQSGVGDGELYSQLFSLDLGRVAPLRFQAAIAPPLAAEREGRQVDLDILWQHYEQLQNQSDFLLVEGVGGLGCPITQETTVADLAWDWRLPAVLVVPVRLGAIGQAVANHALACQTRLHLKGIVLNCVEPCTDAELAEWAPISLMQTLTRTPVLGVIPHMANPTNLDNLAQVAANLELERILPNILTGFGRDGAIA